MKSVAWFLALLLMVAVCSLAEAATSQATSESGERPKIGLVLGGGGARGAAHIGVIKALEQHNVPIDYIAGTSMGAIVGGLYAAGMTTDELTQLVSDLDWADAFDDDASRQRRSFRRKQDDLNFLVQAKTRFNNGKATLPSGFISGQKIDLLLRSLTLDAFATPNFDDLPIPFRAVATDIASGEAVVLKDGDLAKAIRASMSIPAIFTPVEIDNQLLVDGGVAQNLPISVARQMGADMIIAVNVGSNLRSKEELGSVLSITEQLTGILVTRNTVNEIEQLRSDDILILPDLGDIHTGSFDRAADAIPLGLTAALEHRERLLAMGKSSGARQSAATVTRPKIEFLRLHNPSPLDDQVILDQIKIEPGEPLDFAKLEQDIGIVYGMQLFDSVSYEVIEEGGKTGLSISVEPHSDSFFYLRYGLSLSDNFSGDSAFNLAAAFTRPAVNALGAEWRLQGQIGEEPSVRFEFHQPFGTASRYFIRPSVFYRKQNVTAFDNADAIADYRLTTRGGELSVGSYLGNWGELQLGLRRFDGTARVRIGDPSLPNISFDGGEAFVRLSVDTLDDVNFPTAGSNIDVEYLTANNSLGADAEFDQAQFNAIYTRSWGRHTGLFRLGHGVTVNGEASIQSLFQLGGFGDLPGFRTNELSGQHFGIVSATYYRLLGQGGLLPTYVGFSIEAGNVWQDRADISLNDMIAAGSIFVGADTPIAPLYLAYGVAEGSRDSMYLFVGRPF